MIDLEILDRTYLRIAGAVQESIVDGPGFRYVIFTQGCKFHCKGCHNAQSWDPPRELKGGRSLNMPVLSEELRSYPNMAGLAFSGGEPFLQPEPLTIFAKIVKEQGYSLWAYTGFTFDQLLSDHKRRVLLELLDVVVDGPFVLSKKSMQIDFRGSTNQRIIDVHQSLKKGKVILASGFN